MTAQHFRALASWIGLFIEVDSACRPKLGRKVRFCDLPEPVRRCIEQDCNSDD